MGFELADQEMILDVLNGHTTQLTAALEKVGNAVEEVKTTLDEHLKVKTTEGKRNMVVEDCCGVAANVDFDLHGELSLDEATKRRIIVGDVDLGDAILGELGGSVGNLSRQDAVVRVQVFLKSRRTVGMSPSRGGVFVETK